MRPIFTTTRRRLLRSAAGLAAVAALPTWYVERVLGADKPKQPTSPNDRPAFALIGTGGRGKAIAKEAMRFGQLVAVCDVDAAQRERGAVDLAAEAGQIAGAAVPKVRTYADFRELLEKEKDVSIVLNGTPDHWHTLVNISAMLAGKDVYSEKPLTLTIDEGKHLVKVTRESKRVLQTGSQQRSDPNFRLACELARNGRLGKLRKITTVLPAGLNAGPFKSQPVPNGFDWDMWLGQAPKVPYVPQRTHATFRFWYDYSGGTITDWGAHHNDIALWAMGLEHSGPQTVEGRSLIDSTPGGYTAASQYRVEYTYANGVRHVCKTTTADGPFGSHEHEPVPPETRNGVWLEGTDGWLYVRRGVLESSDEAILKDPLPGNAVRLYESNDHMGNFFECVRSRKPPVAEAEIGHRSVTVCHLGSIAVRLGRKLKWDPEKEQFTGDDEASRYLSREMREPWTYAKV